MSMIKRIWQWLLALFGIARPRTQDAAQYYSRERVTGERKASGKSGKPARTKAEGAAKTEKPKEAARSPEPKAAPVQGQGQASAAEKGTSGGAAGRSEPRTPEPARNEEAPAPQAGEADRKETKTDRPWSPQDLEVPPQEGKTRFIDFDLHTDLLHAIADQGFQYCTEIQAQALPRTLAGHDLIGQAQTGTGKTAAFLITAIQKMLERPVPPEDRYASEPRVLALAPTRELALQIAADARELVAHTGHSVMVTVGGMDYERQRRALRDEVVDILVATPGRLLDFLGSQDVFLDQLDLLIIDEADRMLDMGFIPDVKRILRKCTPREERQTLLFSATFNQDVLNLASMWTRSADFIEIEPEQKTAARVEQVVYMVGEKEKFTVLYNLLQREGMEKAIIFANRRDQVRRLEDRLQRHGVKTAMLSGEVAQNKRLKTLDEFKAGKTRVLVATDVAGRGIHVDDISHVFNYNLPENAEDYVHRIGRTARAGQAGVSISFASEDDAFTLPEIEKYIGQKLECVIPQDELLAPLPKPTAPPRKPPANNARRGRDGGGSRSRKVVS